MNCASSARSGLPLLLGFALIASSCGQAGPTVRLQPTSGETSGSPSAPVVPTTSPPVLASVPDDAVWLCKPGLADDPCSGDLDVTSVDASGAETLDHVVPAEKPPIDCFYVYPTVSRQTTTNADLTIDPEERAVAMAQAARFSSVCQVYAPMYRQITLAGIAEPSRITITSALAAYDSVDSAFRDYMANYNHGRGVVFIGHSQGAIVLTTMLRAELDANPDWRKLLVSALLLGGNVTVATGKTAGGSFQNIPICSSAGATGCVVAYSTFDATPPQDAYFGRPGSPLNAFTSPGGENGQVACVNPAAVGGGSGALNTIFPSTVLAALGSHLAKPATTFVAFPAEYSARCRNEDGASWLQVDRPGGTSDRRPALPHVEDARWGLHVYDVNVALGNLVELVRTETEAFGR